MLTKRQVENFLNKSRNKKRFPDIYNIPSGVCTINGYTIHIWKGEYEDATKGDANTNVVDAFGKDCDISPFLDPGDPISEFTITKEHLKRGLKACMAFKPISITVSVDGRLLMSSKGENGKSQVTIEDGTTWSVGKRQKEHAAIFEKTGYSCLINVSPKYLMNALIGMGDDSLTVSIYENDMINVHDDQAEAIIKLMTPGLEIVDD